MKKKNCDVKKLRCLLETYRELAEDAGALVDAYAGRHSESAEDLYRRFAAAERALAKFYSEERDA